ncbi:MAG: head GIN domain-containing protein [Breznakibacter sp.]
MKKLLTVLFLVAVALPIFAQDDVKVETRNIGPYDKLKTSKGINVTLIEGNTEKVEIHVQNANPEDVITSLEGKTLVVKMKTLFRKGVAVQVYVTYKTMVEIQAGSGSSVDNEGTLTATKLTLGAAVDAAVELDVDVKTLVGSASAGRLEISGEATNIEVTTNTGGKFYGAALQTNEAFVKSSTGGQVTVRVSNRLSANVSSGGKVYYYGTPKIEKTESMGGKVEPAAE